MADPKLIVGGIHDIEPALPPDTDFEKIAPREVVVHFPGQQRARLSPDDPRWAVRADILYGLRRIASPVYVEVDADETINRLLIPRVGTVVALAPLPSGDVHVKLEVSPTRRILRRAHSDFDALMETLRYARDRGTPVIVTDTEEDHEIIHAQLEPSPFVARAREAPTDDRPPALRAVTLQRARELFDIVRSASCHPEGKPDPCIPFLYPDDGCSGRAHEMCRLIMAEGEQPGKVWNYGFLEIQTPNHPKCEFPWDWHVAPTLEVTTGQGTELYVIDPALFGEPVPLATWRAAQGDPDAEHVLTTASPYIRRESGKIETDPLFVQTAKELTLFRLALKDRTSKSGPPPYAHCLQHAAREALRIETQRAPS